MLMALGLVSINAFGAWAVSRRRPLVARLFLLAAVILTVAAVAYVFRYEHAWWILLGGSVVAFVSSVLNAWLVLGKVVWQNHVARAAYLAAGLFLAGWLVRLG